MTERLSAMVTLTIGGSMAVCVLTLTARLSRARYAARWRCWVWVLLCLRLAVPISFQLPEQVEAQRPIQIPAPTDAVIYTYEAVEQQPHQTVTPQPEVILPVNPPMDEDITPSQNDFVTVSKREITLYEVVTVVWIAGVIGMLSWYFFSHLRFLRYLRRWGAPVLNDQTIRLYNNLGDQLKLHRRPNLCLCTGLGAPMLVGLFYPKLLLPEGDMEDDDYKKCVCVEPVCVRDYRKVKPSRSLSLKQEMTVTEL